jgi:hypothetical protein
MSTIYGPSPLYKAIAALNLQRAIERAQRDYELANRRIGMKMLAEWMRTRNEAAGNTPAQPEKGGE